jgi:hypothetical protein
LVKMKLTTTGRPRNSAIRNGRPVASTSVRSEVCVPIAAWLARIAAASASLARD